MLVDGAERYLALRDRNDASRFGFDASALCRSARGNPPAAAASAPLTGLGHEGPAELGKAEALLAALDRAVQQKAAGRLKQTLAGAAISLVGGRIHVEPAPPRRAKGDKSRPYAAISLHNTGRES